MPTLIRLLTLALAGLLCGAFIFTPDSAAAAAPTPDGISAQPSSGLIARRGKRKKRRKKPAPPPEEEKEEEEKEEEAPPPPEAIEPETTEESVEAPQESAASTEPASTAEVNESETAAAGETEEIEEEVVDFEAEEIAADQQTRDIMAAAGGGGGGPGGFSGGFKLFLDMLADHRVGQKSFTWRPNHTYVLVAAQLEGTGSVIVHVSDDPVFWELTWNITPQLSLKAGKILVPFGTNEFHHIIGGRVDEESRFLPETWGDYGFNVNHLVYDGEYASVEYDLYAINGFEGVDEPLIAEGNEADNNWMKGVGARVKVGILGDIILTGSAYFDLWDAENKYKMLFYAAGAELRPGLIPVPGLNKLRLRGEWARGEIELATGNNQRGAIEHAFARAGYYAELTYPILEALRFRARVGRINPRNILPHDDGDVDVWEPAFLVGTGKLIFTFAYQFVARVDKPYDPKNPADVAYIKFYLQY